MTKQTQPKSGTELFVPLNKLKKSPRNVRKVEHIPAEIEALAASIEANGMLQNLVVEPEFNEEGRETGCYFVTVGEGRRLAQLLRAKRRQIRKGELIRCVLDTEHSAHEISLAENVIRSAMHPADEYEAFALLHNERGMAADDIAARFGVSPAVVRQRLKLGAVSPVLMGLFREGELTLEQMMALTLTDDHARQEQVWEGLGWDKGASAIRRALTEGQVSVTDRRARFVGEEDYVSAGGSIVRDLFAEEGGGYFEDAALLDRLVQRKLEAEAEQVRAEGWAWVRVTPEFDHRATSDMRRVYPHTLAISPEVEQHIEALTAEYDELAGLVESGDADEGAAERLVDMDARIDSLRGLPVFDAADIEKAGAFISLGYDGAVRIERGFVRKEDEPPASVSEGAQAGEDDGAQDDDRETMTSLPDKLVANLTAQRTAALREEVAKRPDVAFVAVVHALVASTFYYGVRASCLELTARSAYLSGHAPGIDESPAGRASAERQAELAARLPENVGDLWEALLGLPQDALMRLLAHCAALTIDGVVKPGGLSSPNLKHVQELACAVSLDMAEHWVPTAANYFGQVTKAAITQAVREGASAEEADRLADLKKPAMAEAAERLLAGKGWLPQVLRLPKPQGDARIAA